MKRLTLLTLAALLLAPTVALAARPGVWTGPYMGIKIGWNHTSADDISSENAFTTGIYAGYDWQLSRRLVVGGSIFYIWNQETDHVLCGLPSGCLHTNYGSNVYGVDGRIGIPLGQRSQFMPYLKIGYSHLELTGQWDGDDSSWRYGAGLEWHYNRAISFSFEYTHAGYDGGFTNDNFTVGVNYHF